MWHESDEDAPPTISGGTFEISMGIAGGAFCYYRYGDDVCVALTPDLTNYVGAYKMTAGANADGTSAVDYSESDIATYKYAKLELSTFMTTARHGNPMKTTIGTSANAEIKNLKRPGFPVVLSQALPLARQQQSAWAVSLSSGLLSRKRSLPT